MICGGVQTHRQMLGGRVDARPVERVSRSTGEMCVQLGIYRTRTGLFLARRPNVWASQERGGGGACWCVGLILTVLLVIGRVEMCWGVGFILTLLLVIGRVELS